MGRFSPTVLPTPSWTNGMAQGVANLGDALMERRQFNQQKLNQNRQFGLQQQEQDVRNAEAGYTPAGLQPNTSQGLAAISNAGVADASQPASYDPTKSLTYALLANRNAAAMDRVQAQGENREDVQGLRNQGYLDRDTQKYGTVDANGNYVPGAMGQSQAFARQPTLDFNKYRLGVQNGLAVDRLGETTRHDKAMEARPVGGNRNSFSSGGGLQPMTPALQKQVSANYSALSKPQAVVDKNGAVLQKYDAPLPPPQRAAEAIHRVNVGLAGAGADTLANPNTVAPASTSGVEKDGTAASTATPAPQGTSTSTHPNGQAVQSHPTVSDRLPASPTAPSASKKVPLSLKDRAMAKKDAGFAAFLGSKGYQAGVDY